MEATALASIAGLAVGLTVAWLYFRAVVNGRVAARALEQQAARMADLERQIRELQTANSDLRAERSELAAGLASERTAASERVALINDAQLKLTDAFRALSAEALKTNNQSFLDLARTALGQYQESARGDLAHRQQAID